MFGVIKKILLIFFLTFIAVGGLLKLFYNTNRIEWGHHFSFENNLGFEIDSLEITIGDVSTVIQANSDSLRTLEGNIEVPKNSYPHKVTIKIFTSDTLMILNADSFDCYNCDGSHRYKLKNSGAEYDFLN